MSNLTKRANKKAVILYGWNTAYQRVYEEGYADGANDEREETIRHAWAWFQQAGEERSLDALRKYVALRDHVKGNEQ